MNNRLNILGLTIEKNHPASRARILQYIPSLNRENILVTPKFYPTHKNADPASWMYKIGKLTGINPWRLFWLKQFISRLPLLLEQYKFDLVWQNRLLITNQSWFENKIRIPRVFDFDDAIWLQDGGKHVQRAITGASLVFAGNEYLAEYANRFSKNVTIIPSVIDTNKLFPIPQKNHQFTIGWIGSASNLPYLEIVKPSILKFLELYPDAQFVIVSSSPGMTFNYDNKQIVFRQWSGETENDLINSFTVGIMPLADNSFTRGKCSYKILQYMACGKAVIASPVGSNVHILKASNSGIAATDDESWLNALIKLKEETAFHTAAAENGPRFIETNYSVNKFAPVIAASFRKITGK